ncbi:MAG: tetratricopeptide repeat protein, partial [Lentisphaerae bacterium]|nr:tetratricopeptide repeat protein [Lentisphaerota bacterium]
MARDINRPNVYRMMSDFASELLEGEHYDLAGMYTSAGIEIVGSTMQDSIRVELQAIRTKALHEIDASSIMVDRSDSRYPIFQAQASFLSGNFQNAKELYDRHYRLVPGMFKELDAYFCIWLIQQDTEAGDYDRANELAREMMQWVDSLAEGFDREVKGQLVIAYSDIAFAQQEYPKARALYERMIATKEFEETTARKVAELRVAEVDRLTRNFEKAMERLERLARRNDRFLQIESCYQMALIKFEMEDYLESAKLVEQVFSWEPNHTKSRLLKGQLDLQMKKFQEATDVRVGLSTDKRLLVPGSPLRVELDDKTGSVSVRSQNIEVTAVTTGGDKETFNLFPVGDSRTKFRGELPTKLGAPVPGNHQLDLLGNDQIEYDYSVAFKRANNLPDMPVLLDVASDAVLKVSSGGIMTDEEEQKHYLEKLEIAIDDMSFDFLDDDQSEIIVRPGNPIYVRVKDFDQSKTKASDKVVVKAATSSGDSINAVELVETAPHSGVFAGIIPTASAGATAYASDSSEGKLPIHAIVDGNYEGWVGLLDNTRPKSFTVDINDYVQVDKMTVISAIAGRRLKDFVLQTSANG